MTALDKYLASVKARAAAATFSDGLRPMNDGNLSSLVERIRRTLRGGLPDLLSSEKADIIQAIERHREVIQERNRLVAMVEAARKRLDDLATHGPRQAAVAQLALAELDRIAAGGGT